MAIAMPPSDMMFAVMPRARNGTNETSTATGIVMTGMRALGTCHRNSSTTKTTIRMTWTRVSVTLSMARWMSSERSYTGRMLIPCGSPGVTCRILSFTRPMTSRAFWPCRITTMPETTSPVPSRSATPRRRSGPSATWPRSRTRMGVPFSLTATTIRSKSASDVA